MKKIRKTGISLIVMLITIVVIIILAASIVNTVIYNNPMDNAKEATFRSDLQEMKSAYGIRQGDLMIKYKGDKSKITEEDYEGVVHKNYAGEIVAFDVGLAYLGPDKKKQEIAESMDYIIGNPNDSVLMVWNWQDNTGFRSEEYRTKITKIKFITNNKVPKEAKEYWDVSNNHNGAVMAWVVADGNDSYELIIGGNGKLIANKNSSSLLRNFSEVKEIDIKALDTRNVTSMNRMFDGCSSLTNIDLSNFNTSKVTNFGHMFNDCSSLTNLNLSNFDTSKATTMSSLFSGCSSLINLNLSNFDTSKVENMSNMFQSCESLTSLNITNLNTNNVINMDFMFDSCINLVNLDLSNFDTSSVTNMSCMFRGCKKLKTSITIKNPQTTSYGGMFQSAAQIIDSEIKVNYTSETLDLVRNMINECSIGSKIVLGSEVSI